MTVWGLAATPAHARTLARMNCEDWTDKWGHDRFHAPPQQHRAGDCDPGPAELVR
jgi:hypothetical protein